MFRNENIKETNNFCNDTRIERAAENMNAVLIKSIASRQSSALIV